MTIIEAFTDVQHYAASNAINEICIKRQMDDLTAAYSDQSRRPCGFEDLWVWMANRRVTPHDKPFVRKVKVINNKPIFVAYMYHGLNTYFGISMDMDQAIKKLRSDIHMYGNTFQR